MKKHISNYIKASPECARFKATNQKPAGLLRTPVYSQRFEVIATNSLSSTSEKRPATKSNVHSNTKYTCSKPVNSHFQQNHPSLKKATTTTAIILLILSPSPTSSNP
ncbi:hypothetical protein TNCV_4748781 [Trichonephila clavipes]|nr:hypothetical protein TNCV_4748781 [Trichonephila clavipes]